MIFNDDDIFDTPYTYIVTRSMNLKKSILIQKLGDATLTTLKASESMSKPAMTYLCTWRSPRSSVNSIPVLRKTWLLIIFTLFKTCISPQKCGESFGLLMVLERKSTGCWHQRKRLRKLSSSLKVKKVSGSAFMNWIIKLRDALFSSNKNLVMIQNWK